MLRLAVAGAMGRMGRAVLSAAGEAPGVEVVAALIAPGAQDHDPRSVRVGDIEFPASTELATACDVLLEFAATDGSMAWLEVCRDRRIPMVMGSTGHTPEQLAKVRDAAGLVPIVKAANFSIGIQLLLDCVSRMRGVLGWDYDVELVETHHRHKADAPSGTALTILDAIQVVDDFAHRNSERDVVFGRQGHTGERPPGQVGIHAVRMGEVIGEHEVHFSGPGETITIRHSASSRVGFARGALRAAAWVVGKSPGLYGMRDVIAGWSGAASAPGV